MKAYFQTGNNFELKLLPVLISRLDLLHICLASSQFTEVPSTFAIILSMAETTVHDNSLISQATESACLLPLDTERPRYGEEFIISVAPDCTWNRNDKCELQSPLWVHEILLPSWHPWPSSWRTCRIPRMQWQSKPDRTSPLQLARVASFPNCSHFLRRPSRFRCLEL